MLFPSLAFLRAAPAISSHPLKAPRAVRVVVVRGGNYGATVEPVSPTVHPGLLSDCVELRRRGGPGVHSWSSIHLMDAGCRSPGDLAAVRTDAYAWPSKESSSRRNSGKKKEDEASWPRAKDALLPEGATVVMLNGVILGCSPDASAVHATVEAMRREGRDIPFDARVTVSTTERTLSVWTDTVCLLVALRQVPTERRTDIRKDLYCTHTHTHRQPHNETRSL